MKSFQTVRGMRDLLPEDLVKKRYVESKVRECFLLYGYEEIETPILESLELLSAKSGDEIRHRMYAFQDLGGRSVALRPEMTPSIARIVASKLRFKTKPFRLSYIANCFRYDNPQMGRFREFWQAGFELFGSRKLEADAEIIIIAHDLMKRLGFTDFFIKIGNVGIVRSVLRSEGISEADQNSLLGLLDKRRIQAVQASLNQLHTSRTCLIKMKKLLSLKGTNEKQIMETGAQVLSEEVEALQALKDLETIIHLSKIGGVSSNFYVDLGFARGLDYYTGMIFEAFIPELKIALGGGGRYDKLVEHFGGDPTSAVGCSPGIDRIILAMEKKGFFKRQQPSTTQVLVVPFNDDLSPKVLEISTLLRDRGIATQNEITGRSISSALSYASKKGFHFTVLIGPRELKNQCVTLRDMKLKEQRIVPVALLAKEIMRST